MTEIGIGIILFMLIHCSVSHLPLNHRGISFGCFYHILTPYTLRFPSVFLPVPRSVTDGDLSLKTLPIPRLIAGSWVLLNVVPVTRVATTRLLMISLGRILMYRLKSRRYEQAV